MRPKSVPAILPIASIACALAVPLGAWAQPTPRSPAASPDVYKVVAEDAKYRVIEATWKPGQRDAWHSHGEPSAGYNVTDCSVRLHFPDGKFIDIKSKAGEARIGPQVASHSLENTGSADCKLILFEPK